MEYPACKVIVLLSFTIYFDEMQLLGVIGLCSLICIDHFQVCCALTTQSPTPSFRGEPSGDTTAFQYGDTRTTTIDMKCMVNNLQPGQKVSWLKGIDSIVISDNHIVRTEHVSHLVDNDRYSIYGDETRGEYNLQIEKVSYLTAPFDSGRYQCAVFFDDLTILSALIRSRVVQVNIYVVPRMIYPQCSVNNVSATLSSGVIEGEATILSCLSDAGYPTVSMTWIYQGNPALIITNSVSVHNDVASVGYVWIPNMNDESAIFTCSIDHPGFSTNGGERSCTTCSVGPFSIHRRTTTEYYPTSTLYRVPEDKVSSGMTPVGNNDHENTNPTLTTMATVTTLDDKTHLRLCSGERFSRSIIAGTFIGGLVLGVAMTVISVLVCDYLRHRNTEKSDQVSASTATGQANPVEMEESHVSQYEIVTQSTQDAHYQSLTNRSHNDVYTSLQKASQ